MYFNYLIHPTLYTWNLEPIHRKSLQKGWELGFSMIHILVSLNDIVLPFHLFKTSLFMHLSSCACICINAYHLGAMMDQRINWSMIWTLKTVYGILSKRWCDGGSNPEDDADTNFLLYNLPQGKPRCITHVFNHFSI